MNCLVSIILPVFNRATLVNRSIRSLLDQTEPRFEVVVVDDCSTDDTVSVVEAFGDPRVRCVRQPVNRGPSAARNAGVRAALAPLIAFQDSDDRWAPDKLQRQLDVLSQGGLATGVVYSDMLRIHADGRKSYHCSPDIVRGRLLDPANRFYQSYCLGIQTTLVRRELFEQVGGLDETMRFYEDLEIWLRLAQVCEFRRIPEPLVHYYETGGLTTNWRQELLGRKAVLARHGRALARESKKFRMREGALLKVRSLMGPLARGWGMRQNNLYPPDWRPEKAESSRKAASHSVDPPPVPPAASRSPRPFWSVIIPLYNPQRNYLQAALQGVLQQDPGRDKMQICLVDDGSRDERIESMVRELGGGRVEFYRRPENGGLGVAWNTGLGLAVGEWVHLLHQDDLVLPGFYDRLGRAIAEHPDLGAAYVQHYLLDEYGRQCALMSGNPATTPGIVDDWVKYVFERLTFQTPAIVVKREAYERLGGFRQEFRYALDWDMWKRVAAAYPIWYEPAALAAYRRHRGATSMAFLRSGENMVELRRSIEISRTYLPENLRTAMAKAAARYYAGESIDGALHGLFTLHDVRIALAQFREARKFGTEGGLPVLVASRFIAAVQRWLRDRFAGPLVSDVSGGSGT